MTPTQQDKIAIFCYTAASRLFATWIAEDKDLLVTADKLPEFVANYCKHSLHINTDFELTEEHKKHAYDTGKEIIEDLLKWSGRS